MTDKKLKVLIVLMGWTVALLSGCERPSSLTPVDRQDTEPATEEPYPYPLEPEMPIGSEPYPYPYPMTDMPLDNSWSPYPAPGEEFNFQPQPGDELWTRGEVFLDLPTSEVLLMESYPIQVALLLRGNLPTPCHQLRVVISEPDDQNRIQVEVYSLVDSSKACVQVLEPFEARIDLGSYAGAKYSIWVNGELLTEFDA